MAAPRATRKVGPPLWIALVFLAVGVLTAAPPAVLIAVRSVRTLTTPSMIAPAVAERRLGSGTWMIFQRTGARAGGGGFTVTHNDTPDLSPAQVSVTDAAGTRVAVHPVTVNETITRGSRIYTAAVQFHIQTAGRYQIRVNTDAASEVLVARSLGETLRGFLILAAVGSVGGLCLLTGVVLLIVGGVRRSRANQPVTSAPGWGTAPGSAPPGWYPDLQAPGRQRWWDGTRWTEHQS